jgi:hypothetical protein
VHVPADSFERRIDPDIAAVEPFLNEVRPFGLIRSDDAGGRGGLAAREERRRFAGATDQRGRGR